MTAGPCAHRKGSAPTVATSPIRIGLVGNDQPLLVIELFGAPFASTFDESMIADFREDPESFSQDWTSYFSEEIAEVLAREIHQKHRAAGWSMNTGLGPRIPRLPSERGEGK